MLILFALLSFFAYAEETPVYDQPFSPIYFDKPVYTWTDKVRIMIVAPSWNAHSDAIDSIGSESSHAIKISTRDKSLKPYKFTETELNSGIFTGEVILTGFLHDADGDGTFDTQPRTMGNGPNNGYLEADREGAITVSFEFADGVVLTESAGLSWNLGDVSFLQKQYMTNDQAVIRIIDADMNLNPEGVDQIPVRVSSSSDVAGITVEAIESSQDSGLFQATIFFTQTDTSSGNRLYAKPGNTLIAKYEDNTLPIPHSKSDSLEITATAVLESNIPPLDRITSDPMEIVSVTGNKLTDLFVDDQLQILGNIKNEQEFSQDFVFVYQIKDESGTITTLSWISGSLDSYQKLSMSQSWNPLTSGTYTVETFVWSSLGSPIPLSEPRSETYFVSKN